MGAQHTGGRLGAAGHLGHPGQPGQPGPLYQPLTPDDPAQIGGHRIAARLGVGSLGPVYLAYAPDGRPVSLTAVRPELAARSGFPAAFAHDVQAVRRVSGPYTLPVLGSGHDGARYWLASGYVPALTLHAAVSDTGRALPVPAVLRLVAGVAEALRAVHHAGVVHAGLGPGTVLLAADGPRVTGYGVTRAAADAPGIPAFSSPEQAADKPPVPATDVFALGQLAAYAAIGTAPFGPAPFGAGRTLAEEPDLSELPGEFREIVTRCLIKDPALRPSPAQIISLCAQAGHGRLPDHWLPMPLQTLLTLPPPLPPLPPPGTWPAHPAPPLPAHATPPEGTPLPPGATPPAGTPLPPPTTPAATPNVTPAVTPAAGTPLPPAAPPTATPAAGTPVPPPPYPAPGGHHAGMTPPHGIAVPPPPQPPAPGRGPRRWTALALWAAVGAAVVGVVAATGGFDRGDMVGAPHDAAGAPAPTSTAPAQQQPSPAPESPTPESPGPDDPAPQSPTPPPADPEGGRVYQDVALAAGNGLVLESDPPQTRPGPENGTFGYAPDGAAFVAAPTRGALSLLAPDEPGTREGCRAESGDLVATVPRSQLTTGSRLCVMGVDGTTALVTVQVLSAPGGPAAHATLDLTVWPAGQL